MPKGIPKNGINKGWIKKGQALSVVTRKRMSESKKGIAPPHGFTTDIKRKMSNSASLRAIRELGARRFLGTHKEYLAIHNLVRNKFGKPNKCERCGGIFEGRKIHWANFTGIYDLIRKNWLRLCAACHYQLDHNKNGSK